MIKSLGWHFGALAACVLAMAGCEEEATSANGDATSANGDATEADGGTNDGAESGCEGAGSNAEGNCIPGDMVLVPAGNFTMGCELAESADCLKAELPYHQVSLDRFLIDTTETTASAYASCVEAKGCASPGPGGSCGPGGGTSGKAGFENHPVNCVSWADAKAYCEWAGKRLCTESEWEKAARGTDGRAYPWGDEPGCDYAVMTSTSPPKAGGCIADGTSPVGSKPLGASPYGALDMSGNVSEWVADWHSDTYYESSPLKNPEGPETGTRRVTRGGSYNLHGFMLRASRRSSEEPSFASVELGFRCCKSKP